jgi:hypothetical protein
VVEFIAHCDSGISLEEAKEEPSQSGFKVRVACSAAEMLSEPTFPTVFGTLFSSTSGYDQLVLSAEIFS